MSSSSKTEKRPSVDKHLWDWRGRQYFHLALTPMEKPIWPPKDKKFSRFAIGCTRLCGRNYSRPHFSCFTKCWIRRMWYGKMPPVIEIEQVAFNVNKSRPYWKKMLWRWFMTIAEWFIS